MATEATVELLFLETFKHQNSEKGTNVDVVRFPYVVYITEVRVIPPGVRAHTSLPENRAYGETSPHTFQLDLFFNNVSKPSATVFDRLGSLDYDENNSIIFRPNSKVNTDGLVLKGWYNSLTLAIYGSVDRVVKHERESPPPPPPPPPPQQTQNLLKRAPKNASQTSVPDEAGRASGATATLPPSTFQKPAIKAEAVKEEPYSGSPPRPQPRGPRTPPGPPPPDDDEEEPMPVEVAPAVVGEKPEETDLREDFFEPISPDRTSGQQEGPFSDEGDAVDDPPEEGEEEEDDGDVDDEDEEDEEEEEEEEEDDDDGNTVESIPEDDDDGEEEEGEGDDGYEQISSDEDGIADLERESFKYPSFDIDYTVEDLAAVPAMSYDPYDRELGPMLYFNCPYKTAFENEMCRMREDTEKENIMATELSLKLAELLESYQEDRSAKWVDILEEVPALIVKGLSYLQLKEPNKDYLTQLVEWAMQALSVHAALGPPVALNVRQLKAGTKLVSSLVECGNQGVLTLLNAGIIDKLFELLFTEHVSSSVKLYLLKALDSVISMTKGMEVFLKSKLENNEKSGYQKLLAFILLDQTVRVVSAGSAVLQKCHFYELLSEIKKLGDQLANSTPPIAGQSVLEQDSNPSIEKATREYDTEVETPMDMDQLMESSLIGEGDVEKLVSFLDEVLHLLEIAPYAMIQPPVKSFPTCARLTGPPERDDPYPVLYRYLHSQHFQESVTFLLSIPAVNTHPGVLQATRDILRFLAQSQKGLLFLLAEHEGTNLLARALCQASDQDPEEVLQTDVVNEDSFALWLLHATQTLQYTSELFQYFQEGAANEETDSADLLGILHSLYLISFNPIGRSAVAHVFSLDNNLQSLITLMEFYSKDALGDAKSKKLVAYNYACMLVLLVVQSLSDIQMLEHHTASLLKLCKADENNTKLQELGKWLEPLRNLRFEMSCIASLIEYVKQNIDNVMAPEGVGLLTALRALCHVACPPPPVEGQQKDLKWNLAVIQLYSADGMDTFIRILQKLNSVLIQPWRLHVNMGTTLHRVTTISVARCTLTLLKTMLTELLKGGSFEFKDTRVPSSLVALHMLLCSIPISGRLDGEEQKIQNDIVDILLTFTQGVNEQVTMSEETLANNTWSLMLKEVLSSVLKIPEGFFSGLVLLSELLPFPLPLQTTEPIEPKDIAVALNTRKLWSVHLHVQARLLQDIVRSFSGSSCQPLQHMVRRIFIQLCDLASPTALLIMRTVLDLVVEDLQSGPEVKPRQYTGQTARLLGLLDALASHRACKVVILYLINGTSKGDERYTELFLDLLTLIKTAGDNIIHLQCAEYVASILQCLCDQDIAMILPSSQEGPISDTEQLSNSLPNKELMPYICDTLMETVSNNDSSFASLLTCIRTMMFLSEHDFGFYFIKGSLRKHSSALHSLLQRVVRNFSKDSGELVSSFLDFMRQILNSDPMVCANEENSVMEVDGTHTSRTFGLTTAELKQLLQRKEETNENLLQDLEKQVLEHSKEDDTLESLLDNVVGFRQMLQSAGNPTPLSDQEVEPVLSPPESLSNLFNNRTVYVLADVMDDQLKSLSFSPFQADEIDTDLDMVKVDLIELSEKCCGGFDLRAELERSFMLEPTSPGRAKPNKGFKLGKHKHETFITSGKSEYIEPAKRAHMGLPPRGRGRGGFGQGPRHNDLFRQRKQNTSRPPSMHVDDFVAAECKDVPSPVGLPLTKRLPKIAPKTMSRGGFLGNRGGRGAFHSQNRFFTPPAPKEPENKGRMLMEYLCNQGMRQLNGRTPGDPLGAPPFYKGNYNRREGVRGLSWSAQNTPRGNYSENRGGQSNFNRGPPPQLRQNSAGYRPNPRDRASRGRGGLGPSWGNANNVGGGNNNSRGKFLGGNGGRGRHVRAFTR